MANPIDHFLTQIKAADPSSNESMDALAKEYSIFEEKIAQAPQLLDRPEVKEARFRFKEKAFSHVKNLAQELDKAVAKHDSQKDLLSSYHRFLGVAKTVAETAQKTSSLFSSYQPAREIEIGEKETVLKRQVEELIPKYFEKVQKELKAPLAQNPPPLAAASQEEKPSSSPDFFKKVSTFFSSLVSPKTPPAVPHNASIEEDWEFLDSEKRQVEAFSNEVWLKKVLEKWTQEGPDCFDGNCTFNSSTRKYEMPPFFHTIPLKSCLNIIHTLKENWYVFNKPNPFVLRLYEAVKEEAFKASSAQAPLALTSADWLFLTEQLSFYYEDDSSLCRWWKDKILFSFVPENLRGPILDILLSRPIKASYTGNPAQEFENLYPRPVFSHSDYRSEENLGWESYWEANLGKFQDFASHFKGLSEEKKRSLPKALTTFLGALVSCIEENRPPLLRELFGLTSEGYAQLTEKQLSSLTKAISLGSHPDKYKWTELQYLHQDVAEIVLFIKEEKGWKKE